MDTTPTEDWSLASTSQSTASVEASLCVARRFGIFEDTDNIDHALEVELRAALKEHGLRPLNIKVEVRAADHNRRHSLVLLTATLEKGTPKPSPEFKDRLLSLMKNVEVKYRRTYAPFVSLHGFGGQH